MYRLVFSAALLAASALLTVAPTAHAQYGYPYGYGYSSPYYGYGGSGSSYYGYGSYGSSYPYGMPYGGYGPGGYGYPQPYGMPYGGYGAPYYGAPPYPSYTGYPSTVSTGTTTASTGTATVSTGTAQWWCTPTGGTTAVAVGQTQPTSGYTGCSYHP